MLTVQQFLDLPPFEELKIVSGFKGLDNIISSVNIMDNPDALDWFSVGELLLTSGYFFKDSTELQDHIMRQLKTLNCPALCMKPQRYLGDIPANMIALSNELDLPIIELPYGLSFSKIMSRVMEELAGKYDRLNQESVDIHTVFFKLSLHGGGLSDLSTTMMKLLDSSVVLLDHRWNVLHWVDAPQQEHPFETVMHPRKQEPIFSERFLENLPPEFEKFQKPIVRVLPIKGQEFHCTILPVYFQNKHYGYVVLWEPEGKLTESTYIALEQGAMAFALERIRNDELNRTKNRLRRDFLDELLTGQITSKEALTNLADLHGVNLSLHYTAIVLRMSFPEYEQLPNLIEKNRAENEKVKQVLHFLDHYLYTKKEAALLFSRQKHLVLLLGTPPQGSGSPVPSLKENAQQKMAAIEKKFPEVQLRGGIGRTVPHIVNISESFHQAQETLRMLGSGNGHSSIHHFEDFIVQHFLMNNIPKEEMEKYFEQTLGALHRYDKRHNSNLFETLEGLVENKFNLAETSRSLFIHRNTLLYRMEKIKELLQTDFRDAEELLKFHLALKIFRMLYLPHPLPLWSGAEE